MESTAYGQAYATARRTKTKWSAEIKLRELIVANEHKNSELAFESYEKAMSILN